jgi:DNA polymerase-3 subunit alpha
MQKRMEVHSHTEYSNIRLLDCINKPENLISRAQEIGLSGICITDHEALCSHIKVNLIAKELQEKNPEFKIGLGNEIYLTDTRETGLDYWHFILIAKDAVGHKQLRKLSTWAWLNAYQDHGLRVPTLKSDLENIVKSDPGHLIATSACIGGELSKNVLEMEKARRIGDMQTAEECKQNIIKFVLWCKDVFQDDFYIECAPGASHDQVVVNKKLIELAPQFGCKMVIGTDAHYLKKEDRYVHKTYLNSKDGDREVDAFYEYSYLQTEEQIKENLAPSIVDSYEQMCQNSMEIYDKIEFYDLTHPQVIPSVEVKDYPKDDKQPDYIKEKYPILSSMKNSDDIYERYWVNQCCDKLQEKDLYCDEYLSRLEEEADIKKTVGEKLGTNMFSYPITLQHYVDMFWECGSLVGAGRGSSCSGLNHYLLGITQLDPIKWDLPFWRYLNKERIELGDIDLDLCPSKRPAILRRIKDERGKNFNADIDDLSRKNLGCTLIATYGTEGTKSAILTACRGYRSADYPDGIDVDEAQYIASLVPIERGFLWSIDDVMYGNKEKGRQPVNMFQVEVQQYPGLFDIIKGIEGIINKRSSHASGVIFQDEDPYKFGCYMKTPKGEIITQYDLHDAEAAGMTKYDFLVTEVEDKLCQTIKFLQEYGEIEKDLSLREIYDKYFHPEVLPIEDKETWENIQKGGILSMFQFDSDVGSQAIAKIQPKTMLELTDSNGLMRLMTAEKGAETPMEKYVRFKNNIKLWYQEMAAAGLTQAEQDALKPYFEPSYGVPPSQEQLMRMLMDEHICNFSLKDANDARKIVGKKQMNRIPELREKIMTQATSPNLGMYVWKCGVGPQMGYSFSVIHALAYSYIGYQTAYIATKWDPIYWNTSCLVVNSGSLEEDEDYELDDDEVPQKKEKGTDYSKLAKALGEIIDQGITVSLVDINKSDFSFKPDVTNHLILFGMKALSGVNEDIINQIIAHRPYANIKDFMSKVNMKKPAMISLIKGGAFDEISIDLGKELGCHPRIAAMMYYLSVASKPKKRLTLQNLPGLISYGVLPDSFAQEKRTFLWTKEMRKSKVGTDYYAVSEYAYSKITEVFEIEPADYQDGKILLSQKQWDIIYQNEMDKIRNWIAENKEEALFTLNAQLFKEQWDKYAKGNLSSWEMDSLCYYYHEHELANVNDEKYGISNFEELPREPVVAKFFKKNGREIPIFALTRIAGTVISKNDNKHSISLLTKSGVVTVKFTKDYYAMFKRQISETQEDGTKKVIEKGWFTRGVMLLITGFRRDDMFVAKKYASTGGHTLYKISAVNGSDIELISARAGQN